MEVKAWLLSHVYLNLGMFLTHSTKIWGYLIWDYSLSCKPEQVHTVSCSLSFSPSSLLICHPKSVIIHLLYFLMHKHEMQERQPSEILEAKPLPCPYALQSITDDKFKRRYSLFSVTCLGWVHATSEFKYSQFLLRFTMIPL